MRWTLMAALILALAIMCSASKCQFGNWTPPGHNYDQEQTK